MNRAFFSSRRWHRWAGLLAFLWLAVLGLTGWLMTHRENWPWLWERGLPAAWFPDGVVKSASNGLVRWLQVDPADEHWQVAGGYGGAWYSPDAGRHWLPSDTGRSRPLIINALEPSPAWSRLWYGTPDGIWESDDGGRTLHRLALAGVNVTALAQGANDDELAGVADRSRVFLLHRHLPVSVSVSWLGLGPAPQTSPSPRITLNRALLDLHYGRGYIGAPWDRWLNDAAGLGLTGLCLTGLLLWWWPRRWRLAREEDRPLPGRETRRLTLLCLIRLHAKWAGPLLILPLAVLFLTGIYLGHFARLSPAAKSVPLPGPLRTPTYALHRWDDWIESLLLYPGQPDRLSLGTRTGLYTSEDNGRTWHREAEIDGGAYKLRRIAGQVLSPGTMSGATRRLTPDGWHLVAPGSHVAMASEVSPLPGGRLLWKHGAMLHLSDESGRETESRSFEGPRATVVPYYTLAARLHDGALFTKQWKWVNDVFALTGLVLLATGLWRWWPHVRPARSPSAFSPH